MVNLEKKLEFDHPTITKDSIIVVTGAAGFIGSCMVSYLNQQGFERLVLVDEFDRKDKKPNLKGKKFLNAIDRDLFFSWLRQVRPDIAFIFHLGARTDTTEFDYAVHLRLNVEYSQDIWDYCVVHQIPLVYASSAATYGAGEWGYEDDPSLIEKLKPLNAYGVSKNEFDKWVLKQHSHPPFWAGLKFFNVYGPNEYHKSRMASVILSRIQADQSVWICEIVQVAPPGFQRRRTTPGFYLCERRDQGLFLDNGAPTRFGHL